MSSHSVTSVRSKEQDLEGKPSKDKYDDNDEDFGGHEARRKLERRLVMKLDFRMSILVVIYILNYVSSDTVILFCLHAADSHPDRLTGIMQVLQDCGVSSPTSISRASSSPRYSVSSMLATF